MRTEALHWAELIFTLFDADGNGVLEPADFALMAERVVRAVPDAGGAQKAAARAAFRRYGDTLAAGLDADGDGRVTREEFTACVLAPERFEGTVAEFAGALSQLGDLRGDGRVERPVFMAMMLAIGFAPANIAALFAALGPDGGDRVAAAAWDASIRDFYRPDLAGIAGDRLVPAPAGAAGQD